MKKCLYLLAFCLFTSCAALTPQKPIIIERTIVKVKEHPVVVQPTKTALSDAADGCRDYGWRLPGCDIIFQKLRVDGDKEKIQKKIDNAVTKLQQ